MKSRSTLNGVCRTQRLFSHTHTQTGIQPIWRWICHHRIRAQWFNTESFNKEDIWRAEAMPAEVPSLFHIDTVCKHVQHVRPLFLNMPSCTVYLVYHIWHFRRIYYDIRRRMYGAHTWREKKAHAEQKYENCCSCCYLYGQKEKWNSDILWYETMRSL